MSQSGNVTGTALVTTSATSGLAGWITNNATILSLSFTAISCIAGVTFLYLNWKQTKRRNDILENQSKG